MDEELQVVYELGRKGSHLDRWGPASHQFHKDLAQYYFEFKTLASKLGANLPDQLPEEKTTGDEIVRFNRNQVYRVENYLHQHKTSYIQEIFFIANRVEELSDVLSGCIGKKTVFWKNPSVFVEELQIRAKSLGIDISEELSKVNVHEKFNDDDLNLLELKLKAKLCKRANEPTQMVRSEVDPTRIITDDYWAISLVRLPDRSNSEHAFLVLEGMEGNTSKIWFADFVTNDISDLALSGMRNGKVRKEEYHGSDAVVGTSSKLLFRCPRRMMDIRHGDRFLHSTWQISKSTAKNLIQNIETQQKTPPKYNVLGDTALARSKAAAKGKDTVHNCFTFARKMLRDLNDEYIKLPEDNLGDWICSAPSRYLPDKQVNNQRWETLRFGVFIFLAGAVTAFVLKVLIFGV